ncbi:hypothetical protein [Nocardioides dilutus]
MSLLEGASLGCSTADLPTTAEIYATCELADNEHYSISEYSDEALAADDLRRDDSDLACVMAEAGATDLLEEVRKVEGEPFIEVVDGFMVMAIPIPERNEDHIVVIVAPDRN